MRSAIVAAVDPDSFDAPTADKLGHGRLDSRRQARPVQSVVFIILNPTIPQHKIHTSIDAKGHSRGYSSN